jgi:hypothetical protein
VNVAETKEGYLLKVTSDAINPGVMLSSELNGKFSENYFFMTPGTKEIMFYTNESSKKPDNEFKIFTWRNAWE